MRWNLTATKCSYSKHTSYGMREVGLLMWNYTLKETWTYSKVYGGIKSNNIVHSSIIIYAMESLSFNQ
jgi:hypothetical protein